MKKNILVTCFFMLTVILGFSQSLALYDSTAGQLVNNATIWKSGINSADGEIIQHLALINSSANDIPVMAKKTYISIVSGSSNLFCWGLCFGPDTFLSGDAITVAAGTTNWLDFSGHYLPAGVAGASTVRYTFFAERNPGDSVCVNVVYMAFPLGTEELNANVSSLSNAYPSPAKDQVNFNYSIPAGSRGNVIVRNVLGSSVREAALPSTNGKVSLQIADLKDGIYFTSLLVNGNLVLTRKMVVRN